MSNRVEGKVVVVTGAGQGQGAAEARLLAAEGATVVALDLGDAPAEDLARGRVPAGSTSPTPPAGPRLPPTCTPGTDRCTAWSPMRASPGGPG